MIAILAHLNDWCGKHKEVCQKNYDGSAPSMKVGAVRDIFSRWVEQYKLKYPSGLCDGDSKTIDT